MKIRMLEETDFAQGFLETLESLGEVGKLSSNQWRKIFTEVANNPSHHIFVVERNEKIVATATLYVEQKFIHQGGKVGHLEDVAVHEEHQKTGVGKLLINHVIARARDFGCYKIILNCNEENEGFYKKHGFQRRGLEMRMDLPK